MIVREGEVELRLTRARLRSGRRRDPYNGVFVRVVAFWIAPALVVLTVAYVVAAHS
jgi:hypothetical protein